MRRRRLIVASSLVAACVAAMLLAHPTAAAAAINVSIVRPASGQLAGDNLQVAAIVQSDFQVATVTASVEDRQVALAFSASAFCDMRGCHPGWSETLSLTGLARGPQTLTVAATDVFRGLGAGHPAVHDRHVSNPHRARPARVDRGPARRSREGTCGDDDPAGCVVMVTLGFSALAFNDPVVATGAPGVDATLSLAEHDGTLVYLKFQARDSAGQITVQQIRRVYVDLSPRLMAPETVGGVILDVDADRPCSSTGRTCPTPRSWY